MKKINFHIKTRYHYANNKWYLDIEIGPITTLVQHDLSSKSLSQIKRILSIWYKRVQKEPNPIYRGENKDLYELLKKWNNVDQEIRKILKDEFGTFNQCESLTIEYWREY